MEALEEDVSAIVCSGEGYPPALALAREAMSCYDPTTPRTEFVGEYVETIQQIMSERDHLPYFLAKATDDEPGYMSQGESYWIVNYSPASRRVYWVSGDYFIYSDPMSCFDVREAQLLELDRRLRSD